MSYAPWAPTRALPAPGPTGTPLPTTGAPSNIKSRIRPWKHVNGVRVNLFHCLHSLDMLDRRRWQHIREIIIYLTSEGPVKDEDGIFVHLSGNLQF